MPTREETYTLIHIERIGKRKSVRVRERIMHIYKRTHTLNCVNPCMHEENVANERKGFTHKLFPDFWFRQQAG